MLAKNSKLIDWLLEHRGVFQGHGLRFLSIIIIHEASVFFMDQTEVIDERKHNRQFERMY